MVKMEVSINRIINVFENDMYNGCSNKKKLYKFEIFKMCNVDYIYDVLRSGNYNMKEYSIFMIKYPKYRIIMSLKMIDKVINHYITKYAFIPKLSKYLDIRNVATRKNMGSSYGIKLLKRYIELNKKYKEFYILKLDISKFFYNIDHNILKSMLRKELDDIEYKIICTIIDSTNASYVNNNIEKLKNNELKYTNRVKEVVDIPNYKYGKGLPIGNMTSQFLAIYYLYALDHFIVHNLGIKYMVRYMDDYILIHHDKCYLKKCMNIIERKLNNEYKLKLNKKKCIIYNIKDGFDFLGYTLKRVDNKTICIVSSKTRKNVLKKVKYNISNYSNNNLRYSYCSINNYYNSFKYCNNLFIKRSINRVY